ncbi:MAG: DUF962 domain-containing protein [Holophagaceae bacterium]|nr:DUF962 domain-containing protein [Holophagaceae bacterium]
MLGARSEAMRGWFKAYASDHRHPMTHRTHALCIPLIVMTTLGFLNLIPGHRELFGVRLGWGEAGLALVLAFYAAHDARLAFVAAPVGALLAASTHFLPWWVLLAIALPAWVLQLAGHALWEKNKPSFATNLVQLLIGPAYFLKDWVADPATPGNPAASAPTTPGRSSEG